MGRVLEASEPRASVAASGHTSAGHAQRVYQSGEHPEHSRIRGGNEKAAADVRMGTRTRQEIRCGLARLWRRQDTKNQCRVPQGQWRTIWPATISTWAKPGLPAGGSNEYERNRVRTRTPAGNSCKMNIKAYLAKIGSKGGKAKSSAKTAAARKANAARWRNHKPKRVTATPNDQAHPQPGAAVVERKGTHE